ncbi:hypothetical protein GOV11_03380 [Candidatus Woesearchaeota archaeon]|nr:hypothetical protein [Candidatus Woesearchaeota archaeon]
MFKSIPRERILDVIHKVGPVQPLDVRRELGEGDSVLIGAILSEMHSTGKIAITKLKRGGSPFYYDPKLPDSVDVLGKFLSEKDQQTFKALKERKVLREDALDPLTRVSLGNIPDFSKRFIVQQDGHEVAYWRYFLVSEEEAIQKVEKRPLKKPEVKVKDETQQQLSEEPEKKATPKKRRTVSKKEIPIDWLYRDTLWPKVLAFAEKENAELSQPRCIKPDGELTCLMELPGTYGPEVMMIYALSRKTLPETLVWKQLLKSRANGLPLVVLKDSVFPKSLSKKFEDIPNVYFKRI